MDKQAAALEHLNNAVFAEVYVPIFKQACAQRGVTFRDEEELAAALETAAMLKAAEASLQQQGIDTRPSPKKAARDMLKQAMFGGAPQVQQRPVLSVVQGALANLIATSI